MEDQEQTKKKDLQQTQKPFAWSVRKRVLVERDRETVSGGEITTKSVAARRRRGLGKRAR